ncbi:protein kinase [Prosthecobacter sp. SYSU 5D2]|uniref:serine/threonine-protein kinase n=1 Tax=Prosthecobacter sp. SYSU 5D2 TaxID=3134134 RepID=UPI0031FF0242
MDSPSPSGFGKVAAPRSAEVTSHTLHPGTGTGGGDMDFDQTIKFKTPGSGMTVFNRYKLERVLGRGGMGVVWLADDLKLERPVALKFLPSLIGLDPAAVKELKTETRRGLELSHPHIVRIYDFVDDEDAAAISMEFVDGKTLSELRMATENGVFTVDDISRWLLGVCDALDYAHFQRKLIHRDLKPANIMLAGKDQVAKIADFGIARSLSDTMSRLSAAHIGTSGTLPYMSPQQAMGERPQPTDDVYSLGATIYELLSGKPPFYRGDLPTQINSKIPPTVQERRQELEINVKEPIPKLWEETLAACLHKEPTMRPSCAGVMAEMLGLKPSTVSVRTGTYAATAASRSMPEKAATRAPMIAAAATILVGAGAAAWYLMSTPPVDAAAETTAPVVAEDRSKKTENQTSEENAPAGGLVITASETEETADLPATTGPVAVTDTGDASPMPATVPAASPTVAAVNTPAAETPPASSPATETPAEPATGASTVPMTAVQAATPDATAPAPFIGGIPAVENPPAAPNANTSDAPPATTAAVTDAGSPVMPPATTGAAGTPPAPGELTLTPDPATATSGALAAMAPVATPGAPAADPNLPPMPPGYEAPPTGLPLTQPDVPQPASGFWTIEQVFPVLPYASYSAKGKRHLLYRTQTVLKEAGLYKSTLDGAAGSGTHSAIVIFQVRNNLIPNGLLDLPTLAALNLSAEPDKPDWAPSYSSGSSSGYRKRTPPKEEPGFFQKTGDTFKRIFK